MIGVPQPRCTQLGVDWLSTRGDGMLGGSRREDVLARLGHSWGPRRPIATNTNPAQSPTNRVRMTRQPSSAGRDGDACPSKDLSIPALTNIASEEAGAY